MSKKSPKPLYASIAISLLLMAVYLLSTGLRFVSIDEVSIFAVTRSIVGHGGLDASILHPLGRDLGPASVVVPGQGGQWYTVKDVGPSILGVPLVALANAFGVSPVRAILLLPPFVTALSGGLLYATVRARSTHRVALAAALIYGLASPVWPYAQWLYTQPFAALGLMMALYATVQPKRPGWAALAGVGVGFAVASAIPFVLAAPLIALALADAPPQWPEVLGWLRRNVAVWGGFGAGLAVMLALLGAYSAVRFGSPLTNAYAESGAASLLSLRTLPVGLFGLLFGTPRGALWYAPVIVLAPFGVAWAIRRGEGWLWLPAALLIVLVPVYAAYREWWGMLSPGARYFASFMGPVILLCVPLLERLPALNDDADRLPGWQRAAVWVVVGLSAGVQALAAFFNAFAREEVALYEAMYAATRSPGFDPTMLDPAWLPLPRLLHVAGRGEWDTLWMSSGTLDLPLLVVLLCVVGIGVLNVFRGRRWAWLALHAALVVGVVGWMLARYPAVGGEFGPQQVFLPPDIPPLAKQVTTQAQPGDGVLVVLPYAYLRWLDAYPEPLPDYGLPFEAPLLPTTEGLLTDAAQNHGRLWLVAEGSDAGNPALGAEQWLADHAYAGSTTWVGTYRLTLYSGAGHTPDWAPLDANFDGIRLEAGAVQRGAYGVNVALRWRAERAISADYLVFVQLIDENGLLAAQNVGRPHAAYSPTFAWGAGEVTDDRHALTVATPLAPGTYTVIAGLLDVTTGERVPTADGADHVVVGVFEE